MRVLEALWASRTRLGRAAATTFIAFLGVSGLSDSATEQLLERQRERNDAHAELCWGPMPRVRTSDDPDDLLGLLNRRINWAVQNRDFGGDALTAGEQRLARALLGYFIARKPAQSVVISPHAITLALGALALASSGDTRTEILRTLEYHGTASELAMDTGMIETWLHYFSMINANWRVPPVPDYLRGVGIWVPGSLSIDKKFIDFASVAYGASVWAMDESWNGHKLRSTMTTWERSVVGNLVRPIAETTDDSSTRAMVVGAIAHFKAPWEDTRNMPAAGTFTSAAGAHPARYALAPAHVHWTDAAFEAVDLTTDESETGRGMTIEFRLPRIGADPVLALSEAVISANAEWPASAPEFTARIPVFEIETRMDIREALVSSGIRLIFDPKRAELDCAVVASDRSIFGGGGSDHVGSFFHAARFAHYWQGINRPTPLRERNPSRETKPTSEERVAFDRPFIFFAREDTGALIYAGWVANVP